MQVRGVLHQGGEVHHGGVCGRPGGELRRLPQRSAEGRGLRVQVSVKVGCTSGRRFYWNTEKNNGLKKFEGNYN